MRFTFTYCQILQNSTVWRYIRTSQLRRLVLNTFQLLGLRTAKSYKTALYGDIYVPANWDDWSPIHSSCHNTALSLLLDCSSCLPNEGNYIFKTIIITALSSLKHQPLYDNSKLTLWLLYHRNWKSSLLS